MAPRPRLTDVRAPGREGGAAGLRALFHEPNRENFEAFLATCLPLYNPTPGDPDLLARSRLTLRPKVFFHFFRGEQRTFDWFGDLVRIRCPTLILAGELDPMTCLTTMSLTTMRWPRPSEDRGSKLKSSTTRAKACFVTSPTKRSR
jgi:pimeloyl-ACP methyl ester carboxylesterase